MAGCSKAHVHPWSNKVRVGWLCCSSKVWEPIREISSHTTHQGMLIHNHLSLLSHCGLILHLKEWNWCTQADLHIKKTWRANAQMTYNQNQNYKKLVMSLNTFRTAEQGLRSTNSTLTVLENTVKQRLVSKWTSFRWRERTLSLPICIVLMFKSAKI